MSLIIKLVIYSVAIAITAYILPGVHVADTQSLVILAAVLILLRTVVKPILQILTFPLTILTLGLFTFVINALIIFLAAAIVPGFKVDGFFWALMFSFILSVIVSVFEAIDKAGEKIKKD